MNNMTYPGSIADRSLKMIFSVLSSGLRQTVSMMEWFRRSRGVALSLAFASGAFVQVAHASADGGATNEEASGHDHDRQNPRMYARATLPAEV